MRDPAPPGEVSPWALAGLGMQFFVAILLFVYAGNWLDRRLGSAPLFLLGGLFLGGGGSFWTAYRRLMAGTRTTPSTLDDSHNGEPPE
jgi:F0F1-type ATP synthase assembly protein I